MMTVEASRVPDLHPDDVVVDGRRIRCWTTEARPHQLVLLHGASAHSMWWSRVIPHLSSRFQCIAIDSSGHGDSDRADAYTTDMWVDEIDGVCDAFGASSPVLVGHSRGGRLALMAASRAGSRARGLVLVDTGIRPPGRHRPPTPPLLTPQRTYPTFEAARERFRLLPEQAAPPSEVMDEIAAYAIRRFGDRWGWKYDARAPLNIDDQAVESAAGSVAVRVAFTYGERSAIVTAEMVEHVREQLPIVLTEAVPGAEHHLVLSHPEAVADFIAGAFDTFDTSTWSNSLTGEA